ncbi:MAG: aspartate aminotransferase family protein [Legionellaceae bacterium]|nr:aspartate aminotransferase family protein [Legionellaceae bacterium]HCA89663.1 aspartate aminotransferase family protein [Legionellales bacterium]|tara:strand:+ start:1127 stop:2299 length:1173 start_codon:yes stop_codon:yes gene_type:complete
MALITSYNPLPVTFTHGEGIWLYDKDGRRYLDALSGIAVCGLGHAHPRVTQTIQQQAAQLIHTSNMYVIEAQWQLAAKMTQLTNMQQAFFGNSGAEANEAAIKLARLYGHKKNIQTPSIIVMEHAFHGRTMATLTASGSRKVQAGFEPLVPGFIRAPFNDIDALRVIAHNRDDVVAVMLEPIQGEGGIHVAEDAYLIELKSLCHEHDWLLILDEIQTGNGRTGELFAYMHPQIKPDILTTAKGLGNGMPIGACLIDNKACDLFKPGNHGSTFGGNPLACATALTVLDVIEQDHLTQQAKQVGRYLKQGLMTAFMDKPEVLAIRGRGLMLGIELDRPAADMRALGLREGLLFNVTAECVIRLLPPLILTEKEADEIIARLTRTLEIFLDQH